MSSKIFCKILMALKSFYHFPFWFELAFGKTMDQKAIVHYHLLVQTANTIISYHVEFENVQTK